MFCSKLMFRTCEVICNHAARVFLRTDRLLDPDLQDDLEGLNHKRIGFQRDLNEIGRSHIRICAECKGKCCGGPRERDAFIDRVLQDPESPHLGARRRTGEMAAHKALRAGAERSPAAAGADCVVGSCPELTVEGCRIPYELRPIQCTAYFCRAAISALSQEECRIGIRALAGLMKIQIRTVGLAMRSHLGRPKVVRSKSQKVKRSEGQEV